MKKSSAVKEIPIQPKPKSKPSQSRSLYREESKGSSSLSPSKNNAESKQEATEVF